MPKEYNSKTIEKIHKCEMMILKDFIKVCEENGLTYFGLWGTGIGALRHKGFIPWDDDIDVALLRADYEKLLTIFKNDYADKYYIINAAENDKYPLMTTRICIKGTRFIEESLKGLDCPLGIFLDVYALDNLAVEEKAGEKQAFEAWFYGKLLLLKHVPFPVLPFKGIKKKIAHGITFVAWLFLNLFCVSHRYLYKKALEAGQKYNHCQTGMYAFFYGTNRFHNRFSHDDLFEVRKLPFEDIVMTFPQKLEKTLEDVYGDFMQLPPVEKRKNHYPYILEFGPYEFIDEEENQKV